MKPVRPKIHLLDVDEPLLAYFNLTMRCGVTLRNAEPKFMFTEDVAREFQMPLRGICPECMRLYPDSQAKRIYVYGLIEGQEAMDEHTLDALAELQAA